LLSPQIFDEKNVIMNIYISNLDSTIKDTDLKNLFAQHGEVKAAEIAIDGFTSQSRGFGYVEMADEEAAKRAIASLNKSELGNRVISVEMAKPRENHKGSYRVGNGIIKEYRFKKN
jgi:RNA recognition motif-containing protein